MKRLIAVTPEANGRAIDRYYMNERSIAILLFAFPNTQRVNRVDDQQRARDDHGPACLRLWTKRSSDARPPSLPRYVQPLLGGALEARACITSADKSFREIADHLDALIEL